MLIVFGVSLRVKMKLKNINLNFFASLEQALWEHGGYISFVLNKL